MIEIFQSHLDKAFLEFSRDRYFDTLINAKNEYFSLTGKSNEDDEDYEIRMNLFSEWYLLQYKSDNNESVICSYLKNNNIDNYVSNSLKNTNYSIYEYLGENMKKQYVVKDYIENKKIVLAKDATIPILIKGDICIGRVLNYDTKYYLLHGIRLLPRESKSLLKKEIKRIKKSGNSIINNDFILKVEALNNKWQRYRQIEISKIFQFN